MAQGDAVDTYLGDIGRHELLTKEEEVRLGQAIESGRAASQELEREDGRLPPERRCHLRGLIRECERSTRQFIVANLRLVVSIAKRFRWSGVPLPDLIQEGNIGLIEAVRRFDHRRGFRFSTYAAIWIRKAIGRGIATTGRTIRLPVHVQERLTAVRRAQAKLAAERGRTPTLSELAIELRLPERTVVELLDQAKSIASLDATPDDGTPLAEIVQDERSAHAFEDVVASLVPSAVERLLAVLGARDREVLCLRYGLTGERPLTTTQVGERLGVSSERIRQLERRALGHLRPELARMEHEGLVERV